MTDTKNPVKAANQLPGIDKTTENDHSLKQYKPEYLLSHEWLNELEILFARYSGLGITPDIVGLTLIEAWGVYYW